jgi:hypothetical protein
MEMDQLAVMHSDCTHLQEALQLMETEQIQQTICTQHRVRQLQMVLEQNPLLENTRLQEAQLLTVLVQLRVTLLGYILRQELVPHSEIQIRTPLVYILHLEALLHLAQVLNTRKLVSLRQQQQLAEQLQETLPKLDLQKPQQQLELAANTRRLDLPKPQQQLVAQPQVTLLKLDLEKLLQPRERVRSLRKSEYLRRPAQAAELRQGTSHKLVLLKHRHQTEPAANSLKLDLLRLQHLADLEVIPSLSFIPLHEAQVLLDQEHSRQMEGIHLLEERLPTVKVLLVMVLMVCILRQDLHWLAQTETVIHSNSVQYRERLLLLV